MSKKFVVLFIIVVLIMLLVLATICKVFAIRPSPEIQLPDPEISAVPPRPIAFQPNVYPAVTTPTPTESPDEPFYSDEFLGCTQEEALELLACVIMQEAGADYCSDDMRIGVGNVVLNRLASSAFPGDTIEEILTAYGQWGRYYWTGVKMPDNANQRAVERAYECAQRVLDGEMFVPENVVFVAEFIQGSGIAYEECGIYFCYQ